jgi:hypothetical protein
MMFLGKTSETERFAEIFYKAFLIFKKIAEPSMTYFR